MKDTLLLVGGTGFFGLSLLDYLNKNNKRFSKIIVLSRSQKKLKELKKFKNLNIEVKKIKINKINKIRMQNIIYKLLKKFKQDILAFNKFTNLLLKSNFSGKFLYTSSGVV